MMDTRISILLLALLIALPTVCADKADLRTDARYYPLAVGNVWTYQVHSVAPKVDRSSMKWTVTHSSVERGQTVYQVWPKPMQSDDDVMLLAVTLQGIVETTDGVVVLRFPVLGNE